MTRVRFLAVIAIERDRGVASDSDLFRAFQEDVEASGLAASVELATPFDLGELAPELAPDHATTCDGPPRDVPVRVEYDGDADVDETEGVVGGASDEISFPLDEEWTFYVRLDWPISVCGRIDDREHLMWALAENLRAHPLLTGEHCDVSELAGQLEIVSHERSWGPGPTPAPGDQDAGLLPPRPVEPSSPPDTRPTHPCEACERDGRCPFPGVLWRPDQPSPPGDPGVQVVEKCIACDRYGTDLDAARVVAAGRGLRVVFLEDRPWDWDIDEEDRGKGYGCYGVTSTKG